MLIELCKMFNLCLANGRIGNDKNKGDFTCIKPNSNSIINYAVFSIILLPSIVGFTVHEYDGILSDVHGIISLT